VRHGETEWSRDLRHSSFTDVPLTALGERQAKALGPVLAALHPVLVLISPTGRAYRTAELAGLTGLAGTETEPDLVEWNYGGYEGMTTAQVRREHPRWTIWAGHPPPGGETAEQVGVRVDRVLARARAALPAGNVLAIGHGHCCRVLTARWLGLAARDGRLFALDPASPCALGTEHGGPVLHRWNLDNPLDNPATGAPVRAATSPTTDAP
jgi:probable phosphoglycerate mutase